MAEAVSETVDEFEYQVSPEEREDFTIVTFVENDDDLGENKVNVMDRQRNGLITINPVYDVNDTTEDDDSVASAVQMNGESTVMCVETDLQNENTESSDTLISNKRNTVIIEDHEVELRSSPNKGDNLLRQPTWKRNQEVVSEAFDFLKDLDELKSSPSARDDLLRQPTWKRNQIIVSEAFNFLKDLDTGDRNSVIYTDQVDHECEKVLDACSICISNQERDQTFGDSTATLNVEQEEHDTSAPKSGDNTENDVSSGGKVYLTNTNGVRDDAFDTQIADTNCNGDLEPEEIDAVDELPEPKRILGRKRGHNCSNDEDGDSSDEDTGVYRESFRKSTWLYIGDNEEIRQEKNMANYISLADLGIDTCDNDSVFGEFVESPSNEKPLFPAVSKHRRNESNATTLSEDEFRTRFNSVRQRVVQRSDSQQQYKRFTAKCYDNIKTLTLQRDSDREFGIHIRNTSPAIISGVDDGSPAEKCGLKEGQILISVNGVNVIQASHAEIIDLVHKDAFTLMLEVGSGDMTGVLDLQQPVMTGYLKKQVSSTILRTWKKRYFILRKDDCLYYYKTEKDTDPLGAIPLNSYVVSRYGDINKFGFRAEKYNAKTFYFMAETREDMTNWVVHLNEAAQKGYNKDSWMDVTAQNVGLPALTIRKPDCSGYLFKIGRATRRWRKRYCVLKDACIYYYRNASSKQAIGVAHLHGYTVEDSGGHSKKFSFSLRPPESQMRTFSFYTDNDTDKHRWVQALNTSIKKWIKVD